MDFQGLLQSILDRISAKTVYGEPITAEGRTVVPVAKIVYGFGGGSEGQTPDQTDKSRGGGGGFVAKPVGVVEISAAGTRFIPMGERRKLAAAVGLGILLGLLISKKRIDVRIDRSKAGESH